MKAEEFRKGNLILHRSFGIGEIKAILHNGIAVLWDGYNEGNEFIHMFGDIDIEYLQLSEKLLLMCKEYTKWEWFGDECYGGYIPFIDGNKLMIRKFNDNFIFTICKINENKEIWSSITKLGININYFHQLQNLYFALSGEELTIKLQ